MALADLPVFAEVREFGYGNGLTVTDWTSGQSADRQQSGTDEFFWQGSE